MATLESFLSRLMVWVPSCPRPLADQALRDAAIQFCRDTEAVQRTLTPMDVVSGVRDYAPALPAGTRITRVLAASYRGRPLTGAGSQPNDGALGVPSSISSPSATSVRLYPAPDETETAVLFLDVAIEPTRTATDLPDELFDDWVEGVVALAAFHIASIPDQPFTSPVVAATAGAAYRSKMNEARTEAGRSRVRSSSRVRFNRFA